MRLELLRRCHEMQSALQQAQDSSYKRIPGVLRENKMLEVLGLTYAIGTPESCRISLARIYSTDDSSSSLTGSSGTPATASESSGACEQQPEASGDAHFY
jgi:hypothetical protein